MKKLLLKTLVVFTEKHFFLIQNIANFIRAPILKNICERLLLRCADETEKIKIAHKKL